MTLQFMQLYMLHFGSLMYSSNGLPIKMERIIHVNTVLSFLFFITLLKIVWENTFLSNLFRNHFENEMKHLKQKYEKPLIELNLVKNL